MRKGQKNTAETKAKMSAAKRAQVTDAVRLQNTINGRKGGRVTAELNRVVFTPEMTQALQELVQQGRTQLYMAAEIGVCEDLIRRELRA